MYCQVLWITGRYIAMLLIYMTKKFYKKIFLIIAVAAIFIMGAIVNEVVSHITLRVIINDNFEFSCPYSYSVSSIYSKYSFEKNSIDVVQTGLFGKSIKKCRCISKFQSADDKLLFEYPCDFEALEKSFDGGEIIYHVDLREKDNNCWGFVQVWNLSTSLENFLDVSKKMSQIDFINFKEEKITINDLQGYQWKYEFINNQNNKINAVEIFVENNKDIYRVSMFSKNNMCTNKIEKSAFDIIKSLKIKN